MSTAFPQIILFTYPESVYGRRIDWYLTLRGIPYTHSRVLNRLPRPLLSTQLSISYRRIPILAIGRDIYCDTRLIIEKCEELFSANRLAPSTPHERGISKLLETWTIDGGPFWRTAQLIPPDAPITRDPLWLADRAEMSGRAWDKGVMEKGRGEAMAHMRMYMGFVEDRLIGDGREWVLGGSKPTVADIHAIWPFDWLLLPYMVGDLPVDVFGEKVFPRTWAWVKRFNEVYAAALKQTGNPEIVSAEETVRRIEEAEYFEAEGEVDHADPLRLEKGQIVDIFPTDMASGFVHRDTGKLVSITVMDVCIETKTKNGKEIRIHFPRTNFRISKAVSKL
jgi:glutathione S-transferase